MSDRRAYRILDIDRAPRAPNNPRMLAHVLSAALLGVEAVLVRVEVDVASGLPQYATVGLPDSAVRESRERVRSAIYRDAVVGVLEAGVANHCAARTTGGSRSSANWRSTAGSSRCAARWPWASHAAGVAYARSSCRGTTRRRPWPWTVSACSPRGRCALPDGVRRRQGARDWDHDPAAAGGDGLSLGRPDWRDPRLSRRGRRPAPTPEQDAANIVGGK